MLIESIKDPVIRTVRELNTCRARRESGRVVVVGSDGCSWLQMSRCYVIESLLKLEGTESSISADQEFEVSRGVFSKISDAELGPVAIGRRKPAMPYECSKILVMDGMTDPGNVGCLMRSAAAFGFSEVHLVGMPNEDGFTRQAISASRGAGFGLDVFYHGDSSAAVAGFRAVGRSISGLVARKGSVLGCEALSGPIVLAVGSEAFGLSPELEAACSQLLNIPIADSVESLNVAVAGSVGMYFWSS